LDEATKRVRDDMPAGKAHDDGMVPVKELEPRLSWDKDVRALQAVGNVPASWLPARLRMVRCDSEDQAARREPLNELPDSCTV
jgi:hypothetical protein